MSPELNHGKPSTYNNHKCRCDKCKAAWADYIREGGYVKRYQERKRKEKLQREAKPATISNRLLSLVDSNVSINDHYGESD